MKINSNYREAVIRYREGVSIRYRERASMRYNGKTSEKLRYKARIWAVPYNAPL